MMKPGKKYRIAVVEGNPDNVELLEDFLIASDYEVDIFGNGFDLLQVVEEENFDLFILNVMLAGIDGYDLCRRLKRFPKTRLVPVIMLTALHDLEYKKEGYNAGADDYIGQPFKWSDLSLKIAALLKLREIRDEYEAMDNVLASLVKIVEAKDVYTAGHSERVAYLVSVMGQKVGFSEEKVRLIHQAGILHDLGKINVDSVILNKRGKLSIEEFGTVKQHPVIGADILLPMDKVKDIIPLVRGHHEKLDGSGYPDGLAGDQISFATRLLTVADIYDAVTSERPYRSALERDQAMELLREEVRAGRLDGEAVSLLDQVVRKNSKR